MDPSRNGSILQDLAACGSCFVLAVLVLGRLLPPGGTGVLVAKLDHLAENAGEYDTLFLGSSVVYRGYDPVVFDAAARNAGLSARSYNLGVQGFHAADLLPVAEALERLELEGLRHVVVHAGDLFGDFDLEQPLTAKAIAWHDPATTLTALEAVAGSDLPPRARLLAGYRHLVALGYRALHVGRGVPLVTRLLGLEGAPLETGERGYVAPEDDESEPNRRHREEFLAIADDYLSGLAKHQPTAGDLEQLGPRALATLDRLDAALRRLGARLVYVTGIHLSEQGALVEACAAGRYGPVLRYDDPRRYPELYTRRARFDRAHLSREGARRFSALLAGDLAQLWGRAEVAH